MAHRNMVGGTAYDTTGGRALVDGTVYSIQKGKTMVDGTVREIGFGPSVVNVSISGEGNGTRLYVTIRGEKISDPDDLFGNVYEWEMEPGEIITAFARSNKTGYKSEIRRRNRNTTGSVLLASSQTSSGATYDYEVPTGISSIVVNFDYDTTLGISRITFYET